MKIKTFLRKNKTLSHYLLFLSLVLIVLFAAAIRFYKLGESPASISWDEAAVGYNAWSILHWGRDEWGRVLPLVFKSFEDYKHPLHIYLTVPFVAIWGLTDYAVRASSAFFGILNVVVIYFLAKKISGSRIAGILGASALALSPYNIHFSKFNHELNFVLFFFMLGLTLFLHGIKKRNFYIIFGFFFLGLDILGYHSAKVVVPALSIALCVLYIKDLWSIKKIFLAGVLTFLFFVGLIFIEPNLLGGARLSQTSSTDSFTVSQITKKYLSHFSYSYLFETGDPNPRLFPPHGLFYPTDRVFMIFGIGVVLFNAVVKRKREYIVLLLWILAAPLPASVSQEFPHAGRAMYMTGSFHILTALGVFLLYKILRFRTLKFGIVVLFLALSLYGLIGFLTLYYGEYRERYAIEWQYGMKQVVNYVEDHPEYYQIYMTNIRQQPYIFFLFYLKEPLPQFLASVKYDRSNDRSFNTVSSFERYKFGGWDSVESYPNSEVLYIVQPADYTGLRFRDQFDVPLLVKYINGADAFFAVKGKND